MLLENLSLFLQIVRHGSMAAAGREAGMSPATVSERLAALERHYGSRLLTRTTRALSLTEEGRALAEAARVPAYVIFADKTLIEMAQSRPRTMDDMARVNGVGAKKLDSYGEAFLQVIAGDVAPMHPARKALAGRAAGDLFDRLSQAQLRLGRGADGTEKPLSVTTSVLRRIAEDRPRDLTRYLDAPRLDRFGPAFLAEIEAES